jgi:hypothetical protein
MSPVVFRKRGYRAYFFAQEELRLHVHLRHETGEAKFWLEPQIELARNHGLSAARVAVALQLVREYQDEIRGAWKAFFSR